MHETNYFTCLTFHGLSDPSDVDGLRLTPQETRYAVDLWVFADILRHCSGVVGAPMGIAAGKKPTKNAVLFSFDDGLLSDYRLAFPMLLSHSAAATFFVTASNVGRTRYCNWAQLREMSAAGMEIASHGMTHEYLIGKSRAAVHVEIFESKKIIEDHLGCAVYSYAPVGGHHSGWMVEEAWAAGYLRFATMIPGRSVHSVGKSRVQRVHVQSGDTADEVVQLLAKVPTSLIGRRMRYQALDVARAVLGMHRYDAIRCFALRTR